MKKNKSISTADLYVRENLNRILQDGNRDENPRPKYKDGTPAYSQFSTQIFEEYNIAEGEFPIPTLRNTAVKTGIKELMAIYQSQTNTQAGFEENGVHWWNNWMNGAGNIGRAYSHNLESHRPGEMNPSIVKVKTRLIDKNNFKRIELVKPEFRKPLDAKVYDKSYYKTAESDITDESGKKFYEIQFIETGYETVVREDVIGKVKITDIYSRAAKENGYLGDISGIKMSNSDIQILKKIWKSFVNGKNVSNEWHCFATFLSDVRMLPQYHLAKEAGFIDWVLDITYFGSNGYSKETAVFLEKKDISLYGSKYRPVQILSENEEFLFLSIKDAAKYLNVSVKKLDESFIESSHGKGYAYTTMLRGKRVNLFESKKELIRKELSRNQVNSLLHNLKNDPFGRRHIISFWNWANIDKKELVECAFETMWSVRKKNDEYYIDMTLNQRSNDMIMAGAINKIQYVAFMMMVASHLGYKVGKFCHYVHNLHIYDRHIEAANEILRKDPILGINPRIELNVSKNFYDISVDDFEVFDVKSISKITAELEIAI